MEITKSVVNALKLKEPRATSMGPGFLGVIIPYLQANPIKLPLLSPIYVPLAFLSLGAFAIEEGLAMVKQKQSRKDKGNKLEYVTHLASDLTADKFPKLHKFLKKTPYETNELVFSKLLSGLAEHENKEALLFLLENINLKPKNKNYPNENFDHLVTDVFYISTYNVKFLKEIIDDNILQKFADSRGESFDIDVKYYRGVIPNVMSANDRASHSSVPITLNYLKTLPDNFSYSPPSNNANSKRTQKM